MLKETIFIDPELKWTSAPADTDAAGEVGPMMGPASLVDRLVEAFQEAEVVYSHWKSNIDLDQATAGEIDLDLLVDRKSMAPALAVLAELGFKAAQARWGVHPPSICHYYGMDPISQELIHVHLFSRVLTGESFVKSHLLPFEAMLLQNVYFVDGMRVASKPAELLLFTLRMFIKYGSLPDLLRVARKAKSVRKEALWLQDDGASLPQALELLPVYCPVIDEALFLQCVKTLSGKSSLLKRIWLAQKVRRRLAAYTKHTPWMRLLAYGDLLWAELRRRLGPKRKNRVLQAGGALIAFVGADATGKSTLVSESSRWLGQTFTVETVHLGKPPTAWVTAPINLALGLLRRTGSGDEEKSSQRADEKYAQNADESALVLHKFKGAASLPYALRSVALAWDRRRLAMRCRRQAAAGALIVCDRYPSSTSGAMDSPRLAPATGRKGAAARLYNWLAELEQAIYRQIPPPDIVLRLHVPLETALKRNRERGGQDGEAYLAVRHRQSRAWQMPGTRYEFTIDTEQSLVDTLRSVKDCIWHSL
ncbi:MAG: hypothetical protein R2911_33810 [Caldilineaceae bacterium]